MAKIKIPEYRAYTEGRDAFGKHELPSTCDYLNPYGDNAPQIVAWIKGWSEAFEDSFSNWQK